MPSEEEQIIGRIRELMLAIPRHIEGGDHLMAAEKLSDLAELYRKNGQHDVAASTFAEAAKQWGKAADRIGDDPQRNQFRDLARRMRIEEAATLETVAKGEAKNRTRNFGAPKYSAAALTYEAVAEYKEAARLHKLSAKAWSKAGQHTMAASKRVQAAEAHKKASQKWRARGSRMRSVLTGLRPKRKRRK